MSKTGSPVCTAVFNEDSPRSVEFDEKHPLTREQLAALLFEDENDPRSNSYRRVLIRPKIPWIKVIAAIVVPTILLVSAFLLLTGVGVDRKTAALITAFSGLAYFLLVLKEAVILAVEIYQLLAPAAIRQKCRFEPSCSEYMILAIRKYGLIRGFGKGLARLKRCNRANGGFDMP